MSHLYCIFLLGADIISPAGEQYEYHLDGFPEGYTLYCHHTRADGKEDTDGTNGDREDCYLYGEYFYI